VAERRRRVIWVSVNDQDLARAYQLWRQGVECRNDLLAFVVSRYDDGGSRRQTRTPLPKRFQMSTRRACLSELSVDGVRNPNDEQVRSFEHRIERNHRDHQTRMIVHNTSAALNRRMRLSLLAKT